ncbi:MAG: potassium channel protein [Bacteroidia bacterium]|nr:potassium channel protein [Bacteroidia bacterium]
MYTIIKRYYGFFVPLFILLGLVLVGTVGFVVIDGYKWFDAFFMTIITISTVGYEEVQPLSGAGRVFTSCLIIVSFGTFAYAASSVTKFVLDGEVNEFFKQRRLKKVLDKLTDHVIICGYGRNGRQAAQVLKKHNKRFVVIESSDKITDLLTHQYQDLVIAGDATTDEILLKAGIQRAKALIITLPVDADNLFICLTARNLNKNVSIISRASEDSSDAKLRIAGANSVIMPDKIGGAHMASLVMKPAVIEFIDFITGQGGDSINLEEFSYENLPEDFRNKTIKDLEIRNSTGANIVGYRTADGKYVVNPSADTKLVPNAKLFVLGTPDQIEKLKKMMT